MQRRAALSTLCVLLALARGAPASAQNYYWSSADCHEASTTYLTLQFTDCWNSSGPNNPAIQGYGPPTSPSANAYVISTLEPVNIDNRAAFLVHDLQFDALPTTTSPAADIFINNYSTLTANGTLTVGVNGIGNLANYNILTAGTLILGDAGPTNNVPTAGSLNNQGTLNAGTLIVGNNGFGSVMHTASDVTVSGNLILAAGSTGQGQYDLYGGSLTVNGTEILGQAGFGDLDQRGGTNFAQSIVIAPNPGSTGTLQMEGGSLSVAHDLSGGTGGALFVENSSLSVAGNISGFTSFSLASDPGSTGSYAQGPSQTVAVSDEYIGVEGAATYTQNGGTNSVDSLTLGSNSGGSGLYSLLAGQLTARNVYIGSDGIGTFVQSGGLHQLSGDLFIGDQSSYSLSGGELDAPYEGLGNPGVAAFVQSGGTNNTQQLVLGSGSSYSLSGGALNIDGIFDGGTDSVLNYSGGSLSAEAIYVGTLNVAAGSDLPISTSLTVAGSEIPSAPPSTIAGTLDVSNGALLTNIGSVSLIGTGSLNNFGTIGNNVGASIDVNDNAQLLNDEAFSNQGTLGVHGGGITNTGNGEINNLGQITVDGTGTFTNNGEVTNTGGTITVDGGGTFLTSNDLNSDSASAILVHGGVFRNDNTLSNQGSVFIDNTAALINNGYLYNDGAVTIGAQASLSGSGTYTQTSGNTKIYGTLTQAVIFNQGGTMGGPGIISGEFYNQGGTLAPGDPALMTVNGDLFFSSGVLDIKVAGATELDQLLVTGFAQFSGGTIDLDFIDGYAPKQGDNLLFFSAAGGVDGFDSMRIVYSGLQPGFEFSIADVDGELGISADNDAVSAVPVPASFWLLATGLAGLVGFKGPFRRALPRQDS